ncbi:MAG: hypothetical protein RL167_684, partial [Actinomycetota bacterium]
FNDNGVERRIIVARFEFFRALAIAQAVNQLFVLDDFAETALCCAIMKP